MGKFTPFAVTACLFFIMATNAIANERYAVEPGRTLSPCFYLEGELKDLDAMPLKKTAVSATINGVIADIKITQQYANEGDTPICARYIFPASTRAAVHGMRMQVGKQVVTARVRERKAAEKTYTTAKSAGKNASLLTEERPNVFSMQVANIMPGDTIKIDLHYTELLVPTEGIYEFVFPTVVGPRYADLAAVDSHPWLKNPYLSSGHPPAGLFEMTAHLTSPFAIQDLQCPSHETDVAWHSPSDASVVLADSESHGGNRDYILRYRLAGSRIQSGLMLYEGAKENFFMMMMQPPERITPDDIAPREFIFVVDVSGSMHGFPLDTAKVLLANLIGDLRPSDVFNVVLFAAGSRMLSPESLAASPANIARAEKLIDEARGGGGTALKPALEKAMRLPRMEGVSRTVLVVTDGYIAMEKDVFSLIREHLHQTNVFAFGIGTGVNRYLIEGIADAGQGEPFVVIDEAQAGETAARFKAYVEAPVLTHIAVEYDGFDVYDLEPGTFGDLFSSKPLIVCGKWRGQAKGAVKVSGITGIGFFHERVDIQPATDALNVALPHLWARMRFSRLADNPWTAMQGTAKEEILHLGLTYHLLTPFTAFVAVDETVRNLSGAQEVDQPLPMPLGVSNLAMSAAHWVPEPELWLIGLLVFIGGVALRLRKP